MISFAITEFTLLTAFNTPFPKKRVASLSRSSIASWDPVEAPDGTAAQPIEPFSRLMTVLTVGIPRLSRISIDSQQDGMFKEGFVITKWNSGCNTLPDL